jgi:hypothetical protein
VASERRPGPLLEPSDREQLPVYRSVAPQGRGVSSLDLRRDFKWRVGFARDLRYGCQLLAASIKPERLEIIADE